MRIREEQVQKIALQKLEEWELYPFSVICTFELGDGSGLLAITFYLESDLDELLDHLDYKSQCDKTGFFIRKSSNTVILTGMALLNLYTA